ncbi:hypothetical protein VKT23_001840 [Stygiomarasmius scandens]|uniref:Uncharacterized protein n=1 Tax=Marasmiellus scandens TaxID=2682957 RepID=A0ABR1K0N1_9AGAR
MHDECPSLDYAGSVVSSTPSTSVPSTSEAAAQLSSLVTVATTSTRKGRRESLTLFKRRPEEVTFSALFRSHSQRTPKTSSTDYARAEMNANGADDERRTRNKFYSFLTRSRSRSRSKTSSNGDVDPRPDPHSRNSSWSSRRSHHDHSMPSASKPTSILQSRPISTTTTATNTTITPPTPKASRTINEQQHSNPPSRPSTPKSPRRKFFGIPLSSSRKSSISSSRGTSPGGTNRPLPPTDVPPLPHHPDLAHDHDPTPKSRKSRSPIPFNRSESPSPLPDTRSKPKFFSSRPHARKSDIPSTIPMPSLAPHDPLPTPSSSSSSNAPSSSNHSNASPIVSGPTRQASTSRIARRRASTSAATESNASSSSLIHHRPHESLEGVDAVGHIPRITTTPATPSKTTSPTRMSHRKNSLDSSVGYRYRPLLMVDEERDSPVDTKGKGKDVSAKSEKSDASSGSRKNGYTNGRRGPPQTSKPINIRATKHGSFDFERPGWTGGVISRSLSANSGSTTYTNPANYSRSLDSGGSKGVVKKLDKDLLPSKKEKKEREKDRTARNLGESSRKARPSPILIEDNEEPKPKHRTASILGLSSSLGRSSGKSALGSGIARLVGMGHGPFSFEPPVPSPTYSQHSAKSRADAAFSDGEVTVHEKDKDRRRRGDKDRTKPRDRARFEEPLPPPVPKYTSASGLRPNGKGRSLDLGLGLAWAPSKVREDALLPSGAFVNGRKAFSASSRRGLSRTATVAVDVEEDRSKVGKEIADMFKNALDPEGFAKFKKYVLQFDAHEIPFDGPNGIISRAERLLDKTSNLEDDNKRRLVDSLVRIILQNA